MPSNGRPSDEELADHFQHIELMAAVGSWSWDPQGGTLWWSPGMHAIFGIAPGSFDGRQETLFEAAVPEDREILIEAAKRYEATGVPELLKYRIARPDGQVRHVWACGETVERRPGEMLARGYVLDVTDRVEAERSLVRQRDALAAQQHRRLLSLVQGAPLPACVHAEDGEMLLVNERWSELTGYSADELPTIADWTRLAYGGDAPRVREGIEQLFGITGPRDEGEFEIRAKDGSSRVWLFSSAPGGTLEDGRRVVISMAQDLTAQRRLEQEQREYERRVHQAQKVESLGVLAGGIAHDFNNLLTGVLSNASVALDLIEADSALRPLLEDIAGAAEQAAALSRDMLTYAGKQAPARSAVQVDATVRGMWSLLRASVSRRIELEPELHAGDAAVLLGESQLGQVVMNLTTNAADALAESSGRIRVRTGLETLSSAELERRQLGAQTTPGHFVFLEVVDDGEGMDAATAARVFEPFFTTRSRGRGLGMAVILGVLRSAGGAGEVDTAPGRGTRIRLSFPVAPAAARAQSDATAAPAAGAAPTTAAAPVLLVDDEPRVLKALANMLGALGYEVVTAGGGAEALELHASGAHAFAIAIVDLTMPGVGGADVLRALKEREPRLPVLLTTGYSDVALTSDGEGPHYDGLLTKPFKLQALKETLERLLRARDD